MKHIFTASAALKFEDEDASVTPARLETLVDDIYQSLLSSGEYTISDVAVAPGEIDPGPCGTVEIVISFETSGKDDGEPARTRAAVVDLDYVVGTHAA